MSDDQMGGVDESVADLERESNQADIEEALRDAGLMDDDEDAEADDEGADEADGEEGEEGEDAAGDGDAAPAEDAEALYGGKFRTREAFDHAVRELQRIVYGREFDIPATRLDAEADYRALQRAFSTGQRAEGRAVTPGAAQEQVAQPGTEAWLAQEARARGMAVETFSDALRYFEDAREAAIEALVVQGWEEAEARQQVHGNETLAQRQWARAVGRAQTDEARVSRAVDGRVGPLAQEVLPAVASRAVAAGLAEVNAHPVMSAYEPITADEVVELARKAGVGLQQLADPEIARQVMADPQLVPLIIAERVAAGTLRPRAAGGGGKSAATARTPAGGSVSAPAAGGAGRRYSADQEAQIAAMTEGKYAISREAAVRIVVGKGKGSTR